MYCLRVFSYINKIFISPLSLGSSKTTKNKQNGRKRDGVFQEKICTQKSCEIFPSNVRFTNAAIRKSKDQVEHPEVFTAVERLD
jgi:hypothetical protein